MTRITAVRDNRVGRDADGPRCRDIRTAPSEVPM